MKQGKRILAVLITIALLAGIAGSVIYAVRRTSRRTIAVYRASELNTGGFRFDTGSAMEGYVTADAAQNVYAAGDLVVKEILVRRGQEVMVGDVLLTYDTEKTQLNVEKEELSRQQIQLQLDVAARNLATLGKLKPASEDGDSYIDDGEWEIVEIDDEEGTEEEEFPYKDAICYEILNSDSLAYNREDITLVTADDLDPAETDGMTEEEITEYIAEINSGSELQLGAEGNPYRFLCTNGAVIEASFIHHMKKLAEERKGSFYIQLEVRDGNRADGKLIQAWEMDAAGFIDVARDWNAKVVVEDYIATPSPVPTRVPSGTVTVTPGPTGSGLPSQQPTETVTPTGEPTETEVPEESLIPDESDEEITAVPTGEAGPGETGIPDAAITVTDIPDEYSSGDTGGDEKSPNVTQPSASQNNPEEMVSPHIVSEAGRPGGYTVYDKAAGDRDISFTTVNLTTKYLMTAMAVSGSGDSDKNAKTDSSLIAAALGLIPSDAQMTAEEIKEAKKQEEQTVKALKLDLREADLKLIIATKALEEGSVKAKMNGVVKTLTDPDAAGAQGVPVIQVTAAEGLFVRSALPENLYDKVQTGELVSIMSWTTGQSFSGRIRDISNYPDTSGMFGYGNGTTYYPVTIYISERSEVLSDGEWVQVTLNGNFGEEMTNEQASDGIYLNKAFIREDGNGKYVLKRGEDGKLTKETVITGELSYDEYEILSGVEEDDWIAFPYGRNLSEGLETREGTVEELYAS